MPAWLANSLIVLATVAAMEVVATVTHRHIMHGWGWGWHRSHHEPRTGWFERNDLYALCFAAISIACFGPLSFLVWPGFTWIGLGMAIYGLLYFLLHDGLVHRRLPLGVPRNAYLKRLVQAHRLHHVVRSREGCVSFGFLYAPPVARLRQELRESGAV